LQTRDHAGHRGLTSELLGKTRSWPGSTTRVPRLSCGTGNWCPFALRDQIYEPEKPIRHVYFPLDSVLSIVTRMQDGNQIEVGTIGREGMSAFPLLLGASSTANDCYCQVRGTAIKVSTKVFRDMSARNAVSVSYSTAIFKRTSTCSDNSLLVTACTASTNAVRVGSS